MHRPRRRELYRGEPGAEIACVAISDGARHRSDAGSDLGAQEPRAERIGIGIELGPIGCHGAGMRLV
jgi:hypothetical protein